MIWKLLSELKEIWEIEEAVQRIIGTQQESAHQKTDEMATEDSLHIEKGILVICGNALVEEKTGEAEDKEAKQQENIEEEDVPAPPH